MFLTYVGTPYICFYTYVFNICRYTIYMFSFDVAPCVNRNRHTYVFDMRHTMYMFLRFHSCAFNMIRTIDILRAILIHARHPYAFYIIRAIHTHVRYSYTFYTMLRHISLFCQRKLIH